MASQKKYELDLIDPSNNDVKQSKRDGFYVSKRKAIGLFVLVLVVIICVGLIAGLVRPATQEETQMTTPPTMQTTPDVTETTQQYTTIDVTSQPWRHPFLPHFTFPVHYDLYLDPHFYFKDHWFYGKVSIEINVTAKTRYVIVHFKQMNITDTKVLNKNTGESLGISRTFPHNPNQFWVTELKNDIPSGSVIILTLDFNGDLENGIIGYYKSKYINSLTGQESWLATSKFQPTHARKAFPNFDEPKYKATFTVTLKHWTNFTALSNMLPESNITVDKDFTETKFQKSVPMSSYLVCFVVCDFKYKERQLNSGKMHRVWAQPDRINQTQYALEVGTTVQNFLEREYNMTYHMPKLDQIAIPDYPSGATEHWGLITYRVTSLLYDEAEVSSAGKERVAYVVSHELLHNYFGNPVTCYWWDDIWLNEGFATWGSAVALNEHEPTWRLKEKFVVSTLQVIMRSDAYTSSRPVVVPVRTPDQINEAFDGITYSKGASVVRFMQKIMGEDTFREGIRNYLTKYEFKTATTDQLWEALQEKVGGSYDVKALMDPWTRQMGLPLVTISRDKMKVRAQQERFLIDPKADAQLPPSHFKNAMPQTQDMTPHLITVYRHRVDLSLCYPLMWNVILEYTATHFNVLAVIPSLLVEGDTWIKFNVDEFTFGRINYDGSMWSNLSTQLISNYSVFSALDRANLLDDAFNLARASRLAYTYALDMTRYLHAETDYVPWRSVTNALYFISHRMYGRPSYHLWQKHVQTIVEPIMNSLGLEDEGDHLEKLLRTDIVDIACYHEYSGCLANSSVLFQKWIADAKYNLIKPNLRESIYKYGMQESGSGTDWDTMLARYRSSSVDQEKLNLLRGMSRTNKVWLLERYLEYTKDESMIRGQDFFNALSYMAASPVGNLLVWNWIRANYHYIVERFGLNDRYLGRLIPDVIRDYNTQYQLQQVEAFFALNPDAGAGARGREQAVATIKTNIEWLNSNEDVIAAWLKQHY